MGEKHTKQGDTSKLGDENRATGKHPNMSEQREPHHPQGNTAKGHPTTTGNRATPRTTTLGPSLPPNSALREAVAQRSNLERSRTSQPIQCS